jgi:cobalamin synthase
MTDSSRSYNSFGIKVAAVLISLAVAILISYALNNWWLFLPVILLEMGIIVLALGTSVGRPAPGMPWTKSASNYYLFWGNMLTAIGALLILNTFLPGNAIILIIVFLIWMAVFALVFSMRKKGA